MNGINDLAEGTGVVADYQTDLTVDQLDRDDTILKTYILEVHEATVYLINCTGCWDC